MKELQQMYRNFDVDKVGDSDVYMNHVSAMTGENLRSKSEIALELTYRDLQILELQEQVKTAKVQALEEFAAYIRDSGFTHVQRAALMKYIESIEND